MSRSTRISGMRTPFERWWRAHVLTHTEISKPDPVTGQRSLALVTSGVRILCSEDAPHMRIGLAMPEAPMLLKDAARHVDVLVCAHCLYSRRYGTDAMARAAIHHALG